MNYGRADVSYGRVDGNYGRVDVDYEALYCTFNCLGVFVESYYSF